MSNEELGYELKRVGFLHWAAVITMPRSVFEFGAYTKKGARNQAEAFLRARGNGQ